MKFVTKKSKPNIIVVIFFMILLSACSEKKESYIQSVLIKPSTITIVIDKNETIYKNTDDEYGKLFEAINKNWWVTRASANGSDMYKNTRGDSMVQRENTEALPKVQKLSEESDLEDILMVFDYEEPAIWDNRNWSRREEDRYLYIKKYAFIVPEITEEQNIEGVFLISEDDELFGIANEYIYFYNEELYQLLDELGFAE